MLNCCLTHCQTIHPSPAMVNNKSTRQPTHRPPSGQQQKPQALGGNNQHTHTPKTT